MSLAHSEPQASLSLPCLAVALAIMVGGTLYPPLMARADGRADHALALALLWAMSAGFVRGMGLVPRATAWRLLFSGWSCTLGLLFAGLFKVMQ